MLRHTLPMDDAINHSLTKDSALFWTNKYAIEVVHCWRMISFELRGFKNREEIIHFSYYRSQNKFKYLHLTVPSDIKSIFIDTFNDLSVWYLPKHSD